MLITVSMLKFFFLFNLFIHIWAASDKMKKKCYLGFLMMWGRFVVVVDDDDDGWRRSKKIPERSGFLADPWTDVNHTLTETQQLVRPSLKSSSYFFPLLFSRSTCAYFNILINKFPPNMMRELKQVSDRLSNCDLSFSASLVWLDISTCVYI